MVCPGLIGLIVPSHTHTHTHAMYYVLVLYTFHYGTIIKLCLGQVIETAFLQKYAIICAHMVCFIL